MHHCSFSHGLSSFFSERPPHRLVGDRRRRPPARPACRPAAASSSALRPSGGCGAGQGDQPGLGPARRASARRLGRSCVLRTRAASRPCSTNRWRTRSTVAMLTSTASAIRSSGQAGPPSAASALSRMRAWASFWAAALPAAIRSCEGLAFLGGQRDDVLLHVGPPEAVIAPGEPIPTRPASRSVADY